VIARPGTSAWTIRGVPGCLLCAMTHHTNPMHSLTAELRSRSASPAGRRALERFRREGIDVGWAATLGDLVERCHSSGAQASDHARSLVDSLLALAPSDPDAAICALVVLRPALLRIARRVSGREPTADDVAEVLVIAWEEICRPGAPRGSSVVVRATWTRSRSVIRRLADRVAREELGEVALRPATPPTEDHLEARDTLASAVARGTITWDDAVVIALTRIDGLPVTVLAGLWGVTVSTVTSKRRRAEAAIREHLSRQGQR
jgi:DNA-directed RNA polymerase specialized sigma24 family protein